MTRKNDLKDDARHHYFSQEQPKGGGLLAYTNGYEKGFQMALMEVKLLLDRCNNNLDRLNAIKELVKEVEILRVDKVYISDQVVTTELKVKL